MNGGRVSCVERSSRMSGASRECPEGRAAAETRITKRDKHSVSLRWHYPGRFGGYDLSSQNAGTPVGKAYAIAMEVNRRRKATFCEQKAAKKLYNLGRAGFTARAQSRKVFPPFFKKRPFLAYNLPDQNREPHGQPDLAVGLEQGQAAALIVHVELCHLPRQQAGRQQQRQQPAQAEPLHAHRQRQRAEWCRYSRRPAGFWYCLSNSLAVDLTPISASSSRS